MMRLAAPTKAALDAVRPDPRLGEPGAAFYIIGGPGAYLVPDPANVPLVTMAR